MRGRVATHLRHAARRVAVRLVGHRRDGSCARECARARQRRSGGGERTVRRTLYRHRRNDGRAGRSAGGPPVRASPALLIVDAVSGVGGVEMRMDEWGVDVLVAASQKALMCPPGLAFAAVSEKAERVVDAARGAPRFFFDFRRMKASLLKGETPFTPPVSLVLGLREATAMIEEEGLPAVLARHCRLSAALRGGCEALGLAIFPTAPMLSSTVTAARVPAGLDGATIVRHMHARYRTVIAGQRTKLSGRIIS